MSIQITIGPKHPRLPSLSTLIFGAVALFGLAFLFHGVGEIKRSELSARNAVNGAFGAMRVHAGDKEPVAGATETISWQSEPLVNEALTKNPEDYRFQDIKLITDANGNSDVSITLITKDRELCQRIVQYYYDAYGWKLQGRIDPHGCEEFSERGPNDMVARSFIAVDFHLRYK